MQLQFTTCECGCGGFPKVGKHFIHHHHKSPGPIIQPPEQRFWHSVIRTSECWQWTGARSGKGYGKLSIGKRNVYVHRFSWELHNSPIPEGLLVCHHCDNRLCVNPNHLFVGSQRDNLQDASKKGRLGKRRKLIAP